MVKSPRGISVNTHEAKSSLSKLLAEVEKHGSCVRICRNGKPIAELRAVCDVPDPLAPHAKLRPIFIAKDAFAPLSDDEWPAEYR